MSDPTYASRSSDVSADLDASDGMDDLDVAGDVATAAAAGRSETGCAVCVTRLPPAPPWPSLGQGYDCGSRLAGRSWRPRVFSWWGAGPPQVMGMRLLIRS